MDAITTALTPEEQKTYHDAVAHSMEDTYTPMAVLRASLAIIRRLDALAVGLGDELHAIRPECGHEMRYVQPGQFAECYGCTVDRRDALARALEITLTYGLPPQDVSGQIMWQEARAALAQARAK